jgi:hypothetical protein
MMGMKTQLRDSWTSQLGLRLVILSLLFAVAAGCAPAATQPIEQATPTPLIEAAESINPTAPPPPVEATVPSGWESYTNQAQCGYALSFPADMEGISQGTYSWSLSYTSTQPSGPVPNFIYISVIPDGFQSSESGVIYNYDAVETEFLLNMQVGESGSWREGTNLADTAPWFTHTRLPDTTLGNQTARTYENTQPWEFPPGTKEIRYYLQANGCTYLIGGYMATVGSGEPGAISQELFDQIIATFRV